MPEISVRGIEMPESPIRKLAPLAVAAKKRGTKVYHLNIGQPDLPTPQVALDALKTIDREILEYSPSQGYQSYREKLVDYYAKYNISVTADDIIITSGGSEAVLFAFLSCLNPGDEIIRNTTCTFSPMKSTASISTQAHPIYLPAIWKELSRMSSLSTPYRSAIPSAASASAPSSLKIKRYVLP